MVNREIHHPTAAEIFDKKPSSAEFKQRKEYVPSELEIRIMIKEALDRYFEQHEGLRPNKRPKTLVDKHIKIGPAGVIYYKEHFVARMSNWPASREYDWIMKNWDNKRE